MGFSRQEYWSGWPFPPPRDLLDPGIKPTSAAAPALQADSLLPSRWGSSLSHSLLNKFCRFHLHLNVSRYCTFLPCYIKYFSSSPLTTEVFAQCFWMPKLKDYFTPHPSLNNIPYFPLKILITGSVLCTYCLPTKIHAPWNIKVCPVQCWILIT